MISWGLTVCLIVVTMPFMEIFICDFTYLEEGLTEFSLAHTDFNTVRNES